ncbi:MAG TPA: bifunctional ADP-dependent NAD(P)H-hydrate dehydratase/NAD(P)H-hydrate epimerase [Clostridiales bacterium]|nr:bifunctional ADP-dependent NAD(P)H-hydrate dehydratase/NAD(P)H-hydrate epimerase [Clostridiales bacterium]
MKRVVRAQEMRRYEQERFADGRASSLVWMERAAQGVDALLQARYTNQSVLVVCGGGNNGGDGFALLRLLLQRSVRCQGALLADPERLTGDAKTNYLRALECGVQFLDALSDALLAQCDVVVDAIFGTGLSRPVAGKYTDAIALINASGKPVVAVDIPSGVDATSGEILGSAIRARETVTFAFYKRGQLLFPGRGCCGEVIVHPLSDERRDLDETDALEDVYLFSREDAARLLPKRPIDSHKGKNGRALLCVGSGCYTGAALLSAAACLRAGAGLTSVAVPGAVKMAFSALPEAMAAALNEGADWDDTACERAIALLPQKNAVCVGCGVGEGNILPLISVVIAAKTPAVFDADALNRLAQSPAMLSLLHENAILTPHPAEMARLSGEPVSRILSDPIGMAGMYAKKWNCIVLLKGATTCISDGNAVRLNTTGNAGLAKGGSGDVLAGLITGLLAQGLSPLDAASCGAYLLGASADVALELLKERMLLARDVIGAIEQTVEGLI